MPTNTRDISPDMVLANYSSCEDQEIRYEFSPAEIAEMKSEFFRIAADKNLKEELAAGIKAILAEDHDNHMGEIYNLLRMAEERISSTGTNRLAADFKDLMTKINKGYEIRTVRLYMLEDHAAGCLEYYDETGRFHFERRIARGFQANILSVKKASSDE